MEIQATYKTIGDQHSSRMIKIYSFILECGQRGQGGGGLTEKIL